MGKQSGNFSDDSVSRRIIHRHTKGYPVSGIWNITSFDREMMQLKRSFYNHKAETVMIGTVYRRFSFVIIEPLENGCTHGFAAIGNLKDEFTAFINQGYTNIPALRRKLNGIRKQVLHHP